MRTVRHKHVLCGGKGWQKCAFCNGTGKKRDVISFYPERREVERNCIFCNGNGKLDCIGCLGKGYTETYEPDFQFVSFNIPQARPLAFSRITTISSHTNDIPLLVSLLVFLALACGLMVYGFDKMFVAAEAFFLFGGWTGIRAANLFRKQDSEKLETFRILMAIGFGLCSGFLATYLLLTTREGQKISEWITAETIRIVGSLFVSTLGLGGVELASRKIFKA